MTSINQLPTTHNTDFVMNQSPDIPTPHNESDKKREISLSEQPAASEIQIKKVPSKKTKKRRPPHIIFNVSDTKYEVVRYVGKKIFQWRLTEEPNGEWDIFWTDFAVNPETLAKMHHYQKINHFPGMYSLARKNHLGKHLMRMRRAFPQAYKFFPQTYLLPAEYNEFRQQFTNKVSTYIVKPEASCQGRGIFLTRNADSVQPGEHYVVQKYLNKPFLVDGLKFDLRIYVLLAGCDPLRIYVYDDGLARFATEAYVAPTGKNLDNMCMHLTNYAINKGNPNFVFNTSEENDNQGHKRSLKALFKSLEEMGHDVKTLWKEIKQMIIKTFISVQPILAHNYRSCQADDPYNNMCFEILGFDVMLDHKLKPCLLEVNHTPSFTTDTPLDRNIKKNVIKDALNLMNISVETKLKYKKKKRIELRQRILTGKTIKVTMEERKADIMKAQKERDEWESQNMGAYQKVYPFDDPSQADEDYDALLREATKWWEEWTGTANKRNAKKYTIDTNKPPPMVFSVTSPTNKTMQSNKEPTKDVPIPQPKEHNSAKNFASAPQIRPKRQISSARPTVGPNIQNHLVKVDTSFDTPRGPRGGAHNSMTEINQSSSDQKNAPPHLVLDELRDEERKMHSREYSYDPSVQERSKDYNSILEEDLEDSDREIVPEDADPEEEMVMHNFLSRKQSVGIKIFDNESLDGPDDENVQEDLKININEKSYLPEKTPKHEMKYTTVDAHTKSFFRIRSGQPTTPSASKDQQGFKLVPVQPIEVKTQEFQVPKTLMHFMRSEKKSSVSLFKPTVTTTTENTKREPTTFMFDELLQLTSRASLQNPTTRPAAVEFSEDKTRSVETYTLKQQQQQQQQQMNLTKQKITLRPTPRVNSSFSGLQKPAPTQTLWNNLTPKMGSSESQRDIALSIQGYKSSYRSSTGNESLPSYTPNPVTVNNLLHMKEKGPIHQRVPRSKLIAKRR